MYVFFFIFEWHLCVHRNCIDVMQRINKVNVLLYAIEFIWN